jgi:hypothetical protein
MAPEEKASKPRIVAKALTFRALLSAPQMRATSSASVAD